MGRPKGSKNKTSPSKPSSDARDSPKKFKYPEWTEEDDDDEEDVDDVDYVAPTNVLNTPRHQYNLETTRHELITTPGGGKKRVVEDISPGAGHKVVKRLKKDILDNMVVDQAELEKVVTKTQEVKVRNDLKNTTEEIVVINNYNVRNVKDDPIEVGRHLVEDMEDISTGDDTEDEGGVLISNHPDSKGGPVKIIRLGTEEVKKYALFNKKDNDVLNDTDDEEDYDREDREHLFEDEEEALKNDPEAQEWLDNYTEREPEETTLKVSKKYPSKQKFPCPKCPKIWNWPWELRRHLMIHFKPQKLNTANSYKCPQPGCDKKFQWKRDMKQHERIHTGDKLLVCSVCEKKFTTRQALLHHVVVHTGEKPFQCAVCGNRFTQPANLRTHVKKKHNYSVESNKQNKCEYCGEPHASIVGLHQHLLEDHPQQVQEERELLAKEKAEKQAEKLRLQRAKEDRRIQKDKKSKKSKLKEWEMDYEFYIGEGLVRGVDWDRTPSTGEIGCSQCDRKFGWRYEIMFHGLCHLVDDQGNAKNKICPECDTPFKVPIGLKHHLINHTGETPFLCLHCWKSFSSHIDLKLHIKREHLMHLNTDTEGQDKKTLPDTPNRISYKPVKAKIGSSGFRSPMKKMKRSGGGGEVEVEEEKTSHFVQLDDGTYAEMVEGHEMVAPGHQMLVEDQDGQKLVVVNPGPGEEPQTIVIPEQAETVYVIASQDGAETIVPPEQNHALENILSKQENMQLVVDSNGDQKFILSTEVVEQQGESAKTESEGQTMIIEIDEEEMS